MKFPFQSEAIKPNPFGDTAMAKQLYPLQRTVREILYERTRLAIVVFCY